MQPDSDVAFLDQLYPAIEQYQRLAEWHGIKDIFQDNGGKLLQVLLTLGLRALPKREGNDARDANGREYEIKSVNIDLKKEISTHHHLNPTVIKRYRSVDWIIALFRNIELLSIYKLTPTQLEPLFAKWEQQWNVNGGKDINNPKIPLDFVLKSGKLLYSEDVGSRML